MAGRSSGGQAGKAAAIAQLLNEECRVLLRLYTERESLPSCAPPAGQLVTLPALAPLLPGERLCFLHAALRECGHLLEEAIRLEDCEFSHEEEEEEKEYRTQRRTVRDRLSHLLLSTERLLLDNKKCPASVAKVPDLVDSGTFALKKWVLQVLQDLLHWCSQTSETLQMLQVESESPAKRTRRPRARLRK